MKAAQLALLVGTGTLALAFAAPAHADDQTPPPPLMLGTSAAIVQDEPDAVVDNSAPAPVTDSAPAKAVAVDGWELAAKPHHSYVRTSSSPVISRRSVAVRSIQPHHATRSAPRVAKATRIRWYQVSPRQYRPARASGSRSVLAAPVLGARDAPQICELRARKCLQLCNSDAGYTVSQNERWIRVCIFPLYSTEGLDRLHLLLLQRLWAVAAAAEINGSTEQYQCYATQYQRGSCSDTRSAAPSVTNRQPPAHPRAVARPAPSHEARVLAAAVTPERRPVKAAAVRAPSAEHRLAQPRGAPEAAVARREPADSSDGWVLRVLVALVAVAVLSVLLTTVSEVPAIGTTVTGVRTRLASKGLSSSRIDLGTAGEAERRPGGISYRD